MSRQTEIIDLVNRIVNSGYGDLLNWEEIRKQNLNLNTQLIIEERPPARPDSFNRSPERIRQNILPRTLERDLNNNTSFTKDQPLRHIPFR